MSDLPEYVGALPNICGAEPQIESAVRASRSQPVFQPESRIDFGGIKSAFAFALHMHQPLIPAGGSNLATAEIISNLKYMMDNPGIGDNHNASVFHWCYKRMGEFIPQLVDEGKQPRVMLEYSGTLLHGLRQMGLNDVFDNLKRITCDPRYRTAVEWLGCAWGHAGRAVHAGAGFPPARHRLAAPLRRHLRPGSDEPRARVLARRNGAAQSPGHGLRIREDPQGLRLPVGPGAGAHRRAARERPGAGAQAPAAPPRLPQCPRARRPRIIAIIKTQGSDTKLVAQMQPYYEAKGLSRWELAGKQVPPLVTQIADGENGGVMMNEFPSKYLEVMRECSGSSTPAMNATEYLEHLFASGIQEKDLPALQPICQKRIWDRFKPGEGPERLAQVIEQLKKEDHRFHMEGGSWTNNISWVQRLRIPARPDGEVQFALLREGPQAGRADQRCPVPQRAIPPPVLANQLLPLLGPGHLDRLRPRNLPPARGDPDPRLLSGGNSSAGECVHLGAARGRVSGTKTALLRRTVTGFSG